MPANLVTDIAGTSVATTILLVILYFMMRRLDRIENRLSEQELTLGDQTTKINAIGNELLLHRIVVKQMHPNEYADIFLTGNPEPRGQNLIREFGGGLAGDLSPDGQPVQRPRRQTK